MAEDQTALRPEDPDAGACAPPPAGERARGRPLEDDRAKDDRAKDDRAKGPAQNPAPGQAAGVGKKPPENAGEKERKRRRPAVIAIACVIGFFLVGGGAYYWYSTRNIESTDDA
jgi:membrane fusion protein, multidrug efflux system